MKFGIVVFPGTSGDHDVYRVIRDVLGKEAQFIWHKDRDLKGADAVILPGGTAHGDSLRPGAIATRAPVMEEIAAFAKRGGPILGIGNGFQILLEAGLLPGAVLQNRSLRFVSRQVPVKVESTDTRFTARFTRGQVLTLPIAHAFGNYFADEDTLARLEGDGRVVLRYSDANGNVTGDSNPNGALNNIAGIANEGGNVVGIMPHPERASDPVLGSEAGRAFFESVLNG